MPSRRFVEIPGNTVARLPYIATNATMHALVFKGRQEFLQRLCDRLLNEPAHGKLRYHVDSSTVLFTAIYAEQMHSGDPIDGSKGFVKETDVGFWIFVRGGEPDNPKMWREFWLPIYLFVDRGSALTAGREVFGYPKNFAEF